LRWLAVYPERMMLESGYYGLTKCGCSGTNEQRA
jgi:hypothetical protein